MDNDNKLIAIGIASIVTLFAIGIIASTVSYLYNQNADLEFSKACISDHRSVEYREVNGHTVSECK